MAGLIGWACDVEQEGEKTFLRGPQSSLPTTRTLSLYVCLFFPLFQSSAVSFLLHTSPSHALSYHFLVLNSTHALWLAIRFPMKDFPTQL